MCLKSFASKIIAVGSGHRKRNIVTAYTILSSPNLSV
jgi:hypothetical protein